ncbi:hypothetical protein TrRE_jg7909, partial [Triparma retinervis]
FEKQDVWVPFKVQPKYLQRVGGDDGKGGGISEDKIMEEYPEGKIDLEEGLVSFDRYCHVYVKGELEELVRECGGLEVEGAGWEKGNWFVTVRK